MGTPCLGHRLSRAPHAWQCSWVTLHSCTQRNWPWRAEEPDCKSCSGLAPGARLKAKGMMQNCHWADLPEGEKDKVNLRKRHLLLTGEQRESCSLAVPQSPCFPTLARSPFLFQSSPDRRDLKKKGKKNCLWMGGGKEAQEWWDIYIYNYNWIHSTVVL